MNWGSVLLGLTYRSGPEAAAPTEFDAEDSMLLPLTDANDWLEVDMCGVADDTFFMKWADEWEFYLWQGLLEQADFIGERDRALLMDGAEASGAWITRRGPVSLSDWKKMYAAWSLKAGTP